MLDILAGLRYDATIDLKGEQGENDPTAKEGLATDDALARKEPQMTLHSRVMLMSDAEHVTARGVFEWMARIIGADKEFIYKCKPEGSYGGPEYWALAGQGLPALVWVEERLGGAIEVNFDTAYGYKAENGAGCSDLHAFLIYDLVKMYGDFATMFWYDEFNGIWHDVGTKQEFFVELASVYPPEPGDKFDFRAFGDYKKGKPKNEGMWDRDFKILPPGEAPTEFPYIIDPFTNKKVPNPKKGAS